jgi:hypothetical protein
MTNANFGRTRAQIKGAIGRQAPVQAMVACGIEQATGRSYAGAAGVGT